MIPLNLVVCHKGRDLVCLLIYMHQVCHISEYLRNSIPFNRPTLNQYVIALTIRLWMYLTRSIFLRNDLPCRNLCAFSTKIVTLWSARGRIRNGQSIHKPVPIHEPSLGLAAASDQAARSDFNFKLESQACPSFSPLQRGDPCHTPSSSRRFLPPHFLSWG